MGPPERKMRLHECGTKPGQKWDKCGTYSPLSGPSELKPQGLGMVSFSNFNLQMLQIVAEPKKDGGGG
jgi:hypothetical protein